MAKTRVSELAKKYGIPSKEALEKLSAIGEFAKTASSSIELPAVKKFEEQARFRLKFLSYAPLEFISAKTGRRVEKIFETVDTIVEMIAAELDELLDRMSSGAPASRTEAGALSPGLRRSGLDSEENGQSSSQYQGSCIP